VVAVLCGPLLVIAPVRANISMREDTNLQMPLFCVTRYVTCLNRQRTRAGVSAADWLDPAAPASAAAAAAALVGKLTIRGNQVLEDGKPIRMHGINYFGMEYLENCCCSCSWMLSTICLADWHCCTNRSWQA
jgi:hypothetical protein